MCVCVCFKLGVPRWAFSYRQRPGDERNKSVAAEEDEEEKAGGEDPESDGHKHHPAISRPAHKVGAGYQRPVDHPQELQQERDMTHERGRKGLPRRCSDLRFKACC